MLSFRTTHGIFFFGFIALVEARTPQQRPNQAQGIQKHDTREPAENNGRYSGNFHRSRTETWFPPGKLGDVKAREIYFKTHGLGSRKFKEVKQRIGKLKRIWAQERGVTLPDDKNLGAQLGDTYLSLEDIVKYEGLEARQKNNTSKGKRFGRAVENFEIFSNFMWNKHETIEYIIQNDFSDEQIIMIQDAVTYLETRSCLRFEEIGLSQAPRNQGGHQLNFVKGAGCGSYIGRVNLYPQEITLGDNCFGDTSGVIMHEIAHALGLYHQHSRTDRDDYISVQADNVKAGNEGQFLIIDWATTLDMPYDYGSVMHYGPDAYTVDSGTKVTIRTADPIFQNTLGYREKLSFFDVKLLNLAYKCNEGCPNLACARGGYPHPNDCRRCLCPDGFGGALCTKMPPSDSACVGTSDEAILATDAEQCIESPNYSHPPHSRTAYPTNTSCNYHLKAATDGYFVKAYFKDTFALSRSGTQLKEGGSCRHYVELKYQAGLELTGPRFCGYVTPTDKIISEEDGMVVIFRSVYPTMSLASRIGFRLCFVEISKGAQTDGCLSNPCKNGGACQNNINSYFCDCSGTGYKGNRCQYVENNICDSQPCKHGGVCSLAGTTRGYKCDCSGTGYRGLTCQKDIDECSSYPCKNGGVCQNNINSFFCDCSGTGNKGNLCQYVKTKTCDWQPCKHGGVCSLASTRRGYKCDCSGTGYRGPTCKRVDACASFPCQNKARCRNLRRGKFRCVCKENTYGTYCENIGVP